MKTSFGDSRHLKCSEEALEKDQSGTTDRHSWGASLSARANFTLITASLVGVGGDGGKRAKGEREEVGWKRERERERERERICVSYLRRVALGSRNQRQATGAGKVGASSGLGFNVCDCLQSQFINTIHGAFVGCIRPSTVRMLLFKYII